MTQLSDQLPEAKRDTFGLFMTPVTRYELDQHSQHKGDILHWIRTQQIYPNQRSSWCQNVDQISDQLNILDQFPQLKQDLLNAVQFHNQQTFNYSCQFDIKESYLEIANENAFYAPHEHSNSIYSGTYFVNFNPDNHSALKFRRNVQSPFFPVIQLQADPVITPFNMVEAQTPQREGDVIIHQSNLTHGYELNYNPERITLSFNVVPLDTISAD
jgi:uncharacterized protein (TIGR02466 family)